MFMTCRCGVALLWGIVIGVLGAMAGPVVRDAHAAAADRPAAATAGTAEAATPATMEPASAAPAEPAPGLLSAPRAYQPATTNLRTYFSRGGVFMYPLAACSIVALAVILERLWSYHRARTDTRQLMRMVLDDVRKSDVDGAIRATRAAQSPVASILAAGLTRVTRGKDAIKESIETSGAIEMSMLQRGLVVLASIVIIAPLLGFLGTVSGMINAFSAIAAADQVSAKLVASGIEEALITTEVGLLIAIPTQIAYSYFVSRVDRFVVEMEEAALDLVDALSDQGLIA